MEITMESAITVKGQATIPKPVREHLGLKPGDRVKFFIHPDGTVVLLPRIPISTLRGMLKQKGAMVTIGQMDDAVAASAMEGSIRRHTRKRG
jgi:AbrB family looped-hinge helix DNA binding protein